MEQFHAEKGAGQGGKPQVGTEMVPLLLGCRKGLSPVRGFMEWLFGFREKFPAIHSSRKPTCSLDCLRQGWRGGHCPSHYWEVAGSQAFCALGKSSGKRVANEAINNPLAYLGLLNSKRKKNEQVPFFKIN